MKAQLIDVKVVIRDGKKHVVYVYSNPTKPLRLKKAA